MSRPSYRHFSSFDINSKRTTVVRILSDCMCSQQRLTQLLTTSITSEDLLLIYDFLLCVNASTCLFLKHMAKLTVPKYERITRPLDPTDLTQLNEINRSHHRAITYNIAKQNPWYCQEFILDFIYKRCNDLLLALPKVKILCTK